MIYLPILFRVDSLALVHGGCGVHNSWGVLHATMLPCFCSVLFMYDGLYQLL